MDGNDVNVELFDCGSVLDTVSTRFGCRAYVINMKNLRCKFEVFSLAIIL